ncbi:MAG: sulfatase [Planctomycetes bacterium]|nr:sulfatase [Planctomycetota bacterium]
MRTWTIGLLVACLGLHATGPVSPAASRRPNILLITADDLGNQLSCYGETRIRTPHLDALAAQGVRFAHAYVAQSSCSSSRAALLTGRWPHQNGQYGLAHLGFQMHPGQKNLPALLKEAGYYNGIIGKLHVQPAGEYPFDWMPAKEKVAAGPTRRVRWVAAQSRQFFAEAKKSGQPFFYYVNYFDPHGPYTPDVGQVDGLPEKPLGAGDIAEPMSLDAKVPEAARRLTAIFCNMVLRVDAGVGLLLEELKTAGLAESTLIIFLGDNGAPVRHGKTTCYEPGVRVPLIVHWPDAAKTGQVRTELVSTIDIMPTVLAAAGMSVPSWMEGRSLAPLLGGASVPWREFLFTEMNFHQPNQFAPQRTVRDSRYKLLLNLAPRADQAPVELFDLQNDPEEARSLAEDRDLVPTRRRLEAALGQWREQAGDPLLDPARLERWKNVADEWKKSAPRLKGGDYPDVALVPPGGLERLK